MDAKKVILDDVQEQANLIISRINQEIEVLRNDEINYYLQGLNHEIDAYYEAELNDLRLKTAMAISQNKLKTKRDLLKLRQELVNELFKEVVDEILKFKKSEEYYPYCYKKLKALDVDLSLGYLEINQEDVHVFEKILSALEVKCELRSGLVKLGGFRFISETLKVEMDETFDTKVKLQEQWFYDHSGFML